MNGLAFVSDENHKHMLASMTVRMYSTNTPLRLPPHVGVFVSFKNYGKFLSRFVPLPACLRLEV